MIIETERLILRPLTEQDADALFAYASEPEIGYWCGWALHTSIEDTLGFIRYAMTQPELYAVCPKETNTPVGCIELFTRESDASEENGELELGYWVGKPSWGKGYIPEAGRAMLRRAFAELGASRVWCGYFDGNERSSRVQTKLGFTFRRRREGQPVPAYHEVRGGVVNCITKEQWEAQNA